MTHIALVGAELEENLATRYLRAALEAAGHTVCSIVFDEAADTDRAARELVASGAELAGLSMVFTYRAREFADLATRARELGFRGHLTAGGHFAAFHAHELLRDVPALDSIVRGEGELPLRAMAAGLGCLDSVPGVVHRGPGGAIHEAPIGPQPALDTLPWPTRGRPDRYLGLPIVNVLSSRGCTYACAFCSISAWHRMCGGDRHRMREPAHVADEMASLWSQGVRIFNFHDDNFIARERSTTLERIAALRAELARRGVGRIAFAVKARPDSVDEEVFGHLVEMGLFRVFLGIEAGTARSLRDLGRGQTLEQNVRALEIVNRLGLHACYNLLLLNPDSTLEDFLGNVAFLREHARNPLNYCRTEVYAGTPLEKRLGRDGRLEGDYWGYNYRISDPRAQAAFELVYATFEHRSFGEPCIQHLTMSVDYEQQLLAHFFASSRSLRARVERFVEEVNLSSASHLEEIARAAGGGFPAPGSRTAFEADLRRRLGEENAAFRQSGQELLREIREAARRATPAGQSAWMQKAAAVGLAAAITLGLETVGCGATQPTEMAPIPPTQVEPPQLPDGSPELVRSWFHDQALSVIADRTPAGGAALRVELWIGPHGEVARYRLVGVALEGDDYLAVKQRIASLHHPSPAAASHHFVIEFTAQEVDAARTQQQIYEAEMAPYPTETAPYPTEMAPKPKL